MPSFDVIVIGGGTNGLACAARLAKSGRRTIVLESAQQTGGGACTRELLPGYRVPGLAHVLHMLDPRVSQEMKLERHGLDFAATHLATTALDPGGNHLICDGPVGTSELGNVADGERRAWQALKLRLLEYADLIARLRSMTPPQPAPHADNERWRLARLALRFRLLGRPQVRDFMRLILSNIADLLEEHLTDGRLCGLVALDATLGAWLGPRSQGSFLLYLNRLAGEVAGQRGALALPSGGMATVAAAMSRAAIADGVSIRTTTRVRSILTEGDRAVGVILESGEEIRASVVVSSIDPKSTFLDLVGVRSLDAGFVRRVRQIRARGATAKLHLALDSTPNFQGADLKSRLVIAPSIDGVENAFNAVKYGELPASPVMELVLPSAHESGHAPEGHHVLSALVQFVPHEPRMDRDSARTDMLQKCLATLERYAPGIGEAVVRAELLMPYDLESLYGMPGGNWHHVELAADQMLFLRPMIGIAQYSTPIEGLWLAGAGSHPGGGVSGTPGWNAAEEIIRRAS